MSCTSIRICCLITGFLFVFSSIHSQTGTIPVRDEQGLKPLSVGVHKVDLGVGFGLDYGGFFGVQAGFAPIKHLTLFASGGYYLIGFGWQIGIKGLFIPKTTEHTARPFLKIMYGTNSVIVVDGAGQYDEIYNGFTLGIGTELRFGKKKQNGFDLDLNIPLRIVDFWDDWNTVKNDPSLEVLAEPIPIAFSVGFHHEF